MHRKTLLLGMILLLVGSIVSSLSSGVEKVSQLGEDILYVGGSGAGNYTRIQDAIDNASDGDIVYVYDYSSPYYENLIIGKRLFIQGENRQTTIIKCNSISDAITISGPDTIFSGFTLKTTTENLTYFRLQVDNVIVSNNNLTNITILSDDNDDISIINNNFSKDKWVKRRIINIKNGKNCLIKGNLVSRTDDAITLSHCQDSIVCENRVINAFDGISDIGGQSNKIHNNTISTAGFGIYLNGQNAEVKHNLIYDSNSAIRLYYAFNAQISFNEMNDNLLGVHMEKSRSNIIMSNNFRLHWLGPADVYNSWFNRWSHNYWGRPHLLPRIIIVSFGEQFPPFWEIRIPWVNIDFNPAKIPNEAGVI